MKGRACNKRAPFLEGNADAAQVWFEANLRNAAFRTKVGFHDAWV